MVAVMILCHMSVVMCHCVSDVDVSVTVVTKCDDDNDDNVS